MPACFAFWIGATMPAVSRMATTMRSGFEATAWLNFCTCVPGSIVVRSVILAPVSASSSL